MSFARLCRASSSKRVYFELLPRVAVWLQWYIWPILIMMTLGGGDAPQQKRK